MFQRRGPRTRYRTITSIIFVLLYWYFVIYTISEDSESSEVPEHINEIPTDIEFNIKKRNKKLNIIIKNIKNHTTEENMQALYRLFLEGITYKYGKQYEHMTLQEIQENKALSEHIVQLLTQLYAPIYNQEEKSEDEQKKLAKEIKNVVVESLENDKTKLSEEEI